ncbi:MAG: peptidoglycan-binding protein, partial [Lachnospiraceae bacterium]|nr:peptidoglycan-binding protein [Lachnospiraceae bacterium]
MLSYNKGSGKVLAGLTRRRKAERELFLSGVTAPAKGNPYTEPSKSVRLGSKGNDVRWLQYELNRHGYKLIVDGSAGNLTIGTVMDFQRTHGLTPDGICGPATREK